MNLMKERSIKKKTQSLIKEYKNSDWSRKQSILNQLKKYKDSLMSKRINDLLLRSINDNHPRIRIEIIDMLNNYKSKEALEKIIPISINDRNANVKWHALEHLSRYPYIKSKKAFLINLKSNDWLIHETSLKALLSTSNKTEQKKYLRYILKGLKSDKISTRNAVLTNIKIKDEKIYNIIRKNILMEKTAVVNLKASIEAINGYKLDREIETKLKLLLLHWDSNVRILSLRALKKNIILQKI